MRAVRHRCVTTVTHSTSINKSDDSSLMVDAQRALICSWIVAELGYTGFRVFALWVETGCAVALSAKVWVYGTGVPRSPKVKVPHGTDARILPR